MKMVSREDLKNKGWKKQTVCSGPRLNDIIESYEEAGYEVMTVPAVEDDLGCGVCMDETLKVVYTRPKQEQELEGLF